MAPTWGEAIAKLTTIATDIHNTLLSILSQLGGGEPSIPPEPITIAYPSKDKKTLPAGTTTIDTKEGTATLPSGAVENLSANIPEDICRSLLLDTNAKIELTLKNGSKISLVSSIYPSKIRLHHTTFDKILIKCYANTDIQLFMSNIESPTIEDIATSTNKPTFYTNTKSTTTASTAVQCPTKDVPSGYPVVVKAKRANTGYIYPGESKAQAEAHNVELSSKESVSLQVTNVNAIWIDSSVDAEGVEIIVEAES